MPVTNLPDIAYCINTASLSKLKTAYVSVANSNFINIPKNNIK